MNAFSLFLILFFCSSVFAQKVKKESVSKEEIRQAVKLQLPEIQQCYSNALLKNKDLAGKLVLSWVINDQGQAEQVKVIASVENNFDGCVSESLQKASFPKSPKGVTVQVDQYPFIFKTKASESSSPQTSD